MFTIRRCHSVQIKRQKIYQQQPQINPPINVQHQNFTSPFPRRNFSKKLSLTHTKHKNNQSNKPFPKTHSPANTKNQQHSSNLFIQNQQPSTSQTHKRPKRLNEIPGCNLISPSIRHRRMGQKEEQDSLFQQQSKEIQKKVFLRKGSNLQKQIIVNLLRNKILREKQWENRKQYGNQQILKMINVFKGVALSSGGQCKKALGSGAKGKDEWIRQVVGWQSVKEELMEREEQKF